MTQSMREATLRSRFAQGDWLAGELAQLRQLRRLARHPFLQRWLAGKLTPCDLQVFAAEHHHAVVVLEDVARRAAAVTEGLLAEHLVRYAEEQAESIELSYEFASATGWGRSAYRDNSPRSSSATGSTHAPSGTSCAAPNARRAMQRSARPRSPACCPSSRRKPW
jgi:hypothetical protein